MMEVSPWDRNLIPNLTPSPTSGARAYLFSDTHFQELTAFRRLSRHLFRLGSGDCLNQPALLD